MFTIERRLGLIEQIPTHLADVGKSRALVFYAVFPEIRCREFFAQDSRRAANQRGSDSDHASVRVIDGQCDVEDIVSC